MADYDLIIRQAFKTPSLAKGEKKARLYDFAISDGKFVTIAENVKGVAESEIDARGKYLLPAGIDEHVHFNEPGREAWEGLTSGSRALASGGNCAFFDMPLNSSPPTLNAQAFLKKKRLALAKSCLDFGLWGGLTPTNLNELEAMADEGAIGFKAFMSPSGLDDFSHTDKKTLRHGMKIASARNLPVGVHAEDPGIIAKLTNDVQKSGKKSLLDFFHSRPIQAELEAIKMAIELAGETACRLLIVHISTPASLELVKEARASGVKVYAETCPHYLLLDEEKAQRIGASAKCAPPLRTVEIRKQMLEQTAELGFDSIGSDHSPCTLELKKGDDFFKIWGGISGAQHALPLFLHALYRHNGGVIFDEQCRLFSSNIRNFFNLPKDYLAIKENAEANFFLIDFGKLQRICKEDLLYKNKITPYLGFKSPFIHSLYLRGNNVKNAKIKFLSPNLA